MPATKRPLTEQIASWLQRVDEPVKSAASKSKPKATTKKAEMGDSDHVTEDVDDGTRSPDPGARAAENTADIKSDVPGPAVDEVDPGSGGSQDDKQKHIGLNPSAVGEDPATEDGFKSTKEDPGTSSIADFGDNEKYSSLNIKQLLNLAEKRANQVLADLHSLTQDKTAAAPTPAANKPVSNQGNPQPQAPAFNFDAGLDKIAEDVIEQAIRDAEIDADLFGPYYTAYYQGRMKRAEGEEGPPPEEEGGEGEAPPEEEVGPGPVIPPEAMGGAGGAPGGDVLSALGDLGGAGGPPGAEGGAPPGAGGPPPDMGGAGPGGPGGVSQDQALQELAMALEEAGIPVAELAAAAQGQGEKLAAAVTAFKRSGKFKWEEAKSATQRQLRDQAKNYVLELTGNK